MKKLITLVFVSALGGIITLGAYKLMIEKDRTETVSTTPEPTAAFIPTSHTNSSFLKNKAIGDLDFTSAAESTLNAVVHVKNKTVSGSQPTIQDLFFGRVPQKAQIGTGSGVIISPDGYIVTNNHVIEGSQELWITLNDNRTVKGKIVGTDEKTDIALLKIETEDDLPTVTFGNSDAAKVGEWVLAVGNPFNLTSTVTAGIISAKSRDLDVSGKYLQSFIQTDAAVNPGNSGGALVNTEGDLIGINTAISSQTGSYVGYSFAVPSNIVRKVINDLMEFGNVQKGILGVVGGTLNSGYAEKIGISETQGFYVDDVEEDSGAEEAGIKSGDIIKKVDQVNITKFSDLRGYLSSKSPNDVVNVTLLRNGVIKEMPVKLLRNQTVTLPVIGIVKNAKPKELRKVKTDYGVKLVRFMNEKDAQYWKRNGVYEGTIITAINDTKIKDVSDIETIMKNRSPYESLRIELINSEGEKERYNFR